MSKGLAQFILKIVPSPDLSDAEVRLLLAIYAVSGFDGECGMTDREIGQMIGKSEASASRYVGALIGKGWIQRRGGATFRRRLALWGPGPRD